MGHQPAQASASLGKDRRGLPAADPSLLPPPLHGPNHAPPGLPPCLQIVCGNRAGALTILLDEHHRWDSAEALQGEERPHFLARSLPEVQAVLQQRVQLLPPPLPPQPLTD